MNHRTVALKAPNELFRIGGSENKPDRAISRMLECQKRPFCQGIDLKRPVGFVHRRKPSTFNRC